MADLNIQNEFRLDLDEELFNVIGKSVTLTRKSSPVYNVRGEEENVTDTPSSITIVPYNIIDARQSYQSFGNLEEGDLDAAVPYTVSLDIDDVITMESVDYRIKQVDKNYLPDNVVTIIRLTKDQDA